MSELGRGKSLRDEFAMKALGVMCNHGACLSVGEEKDGACGAEIEVHGKERVAVACYQIADAMMRAREQTRKTEGE